MNYFKTFEQFNESSETYPLRKSNFSMIFKTEFGDVYTVKLVPKNIVVEGSNIYYLELYFFINGSSSQVSNKGNMSKVLNTIGKAILKCIKLNKEYYTSIIFINGVRKDTSDTGEVSKRTKTYMRYFPKFLPGYEMSNVNDKLVFYWPSIKSDAFKLLGKEAEVDYI